MRQIGIIGCVLLLGVSAVLFAYGAIKLARAEEAKNGTEKANLDADIPGVQVTTAPPKNEDAELRGRASTFLGLSAVGGLVGLSGLAWLTFGRKPSPN